VAAFIIAIITGFLALYLNQPTWGSAGDIIGALLWGLGISAATASVTGFASIQQILTRTS
jgi:NO-binding membrane sensor protein with MHYT domain